MRRWLVLIGGCGALLALLWLVGGRRGDPRGSGAVEPAARGSSAPSALAAAGALDAPADDGRLPAEAARARLPAAAPATLGVAARELQYDFELEVAVRDEGQRPSPGARVLLAPRGGELRRAGTTDTQGRVHVALRGRTAQLALEFAAEAEGEWSGLWSLALTAGVPLEVALTLGPRWRRSGEAPTAGDRAPSWLGNAHGLAEDARDQGFFEERAAVLRCPRANGLVSYEDDGRAFSVAASGVRIESGSFFGSSSGIGFVSRRSFAVQSAPPPCFVSGRVLDARGRPVSAALVSARSADHAQTQELSAEDGRFRLGPLAAGTFELRAEDADGARDTTTLELVAGDALEWHAHLALMPRFGGRLVDVGGAALFHWTVELFEADASQALSDVVTTDANGAFAFERWPAGPFALLLHRGGAADLPLRVVPQRWAGELGELVLGARELATASLALAVLDPEGTPLADAEPRLWQLTSGRGAGLDFTAGDGRYHAGGLAPGSYRLELATRYGVQALGPLELEPGTATELGEVRFAPPALLALRGAQRVEMTLWHVLPEAVTRVWVGADDVVFALAPGAYRLSARAGEGVRELALASGERAALSLGRSGDELAFHDGAARVRAPSFDRAGAIDTYGNVCLQCHE
ncbi:MAG: carboxypeptidase regulatory-like domain-containing protein [Planctomycetes bacterium]|nr:carboxypeptidase regulatory-like domain-containing protein [Planctomycetota bacterium]